MLKLRNSSKWRNRTRAVSIASRYSTTELLRFALLFLRNLQHLPVHCAVQCKCSTSPGHNSYIIVSAVLEFGFAFIGSTAMKVPTITTSFLSVCAKGRAE